MTVQSVPRRVEGSPLIAAVLVAGLAAGFVAGQAVPKMLDLGFGATTLEPAAGITLGRLDDYGIRAMGAGSVPASLPSVVRDDWGLRHPSAAQIGARSQDDYGLRHRSWGGE